MDTQFKAKPVVTALLGLTLLLAPLASSTMPSALTVKADAIVVDPAFGKVWNHCDKPVQDGASQRSWMWGPGSFYTAFEPYYEGPRGEHMVSYYDKTRMEINDPNGNRNSEWFVTNGLLVVDMISGRIQVGDAMFAPAAAARIPVAGDVLSSVNAPTYASLSKVASLNGDKRAPNRTGLGIREGLGRSGNVGTVDNLAGYARYGIYEPTLGHNIADVFWGFMNQKGITYHDGRYVQNDVVVDWLFAMGYPITEPYWIELKVNGQDRWVLMQAFQRRILTYSPNNPEGWKVEMGNVGRAYYDWRYNQLGLQPAPITPIAAPTPTPAPKADIIIDPERGNINTRITLYGKHFPAYSAVIIGVEKPSANYFRVITTLAARGDGTFETSVTLPPDAAQLGEVVITASANAGAVKATQTFRLAYNPVITVTPAEVVVNGSIQVQGDGFPAQTDVTLGMLFSDGRTEKLTTTETDKNGYVDATVAIRHKAVGTQFRVVAAADGGLKATSRSVIVIAQPSVQVNPASGPAGVNVTFSGHNWPMYRTIYVGIKVANSQSEGWFPNPVTTDAWGNFSTSISIGREYAPYSEVRLLAFESVSTVRLETSYYINRPPTPTPTPVPAVPAVAVNPNVVAVGQVTSATGSGWPAGASVSLAVGRNGVEEPVGVAHADANGRFTHGFVLSTRWQNAGQIILTAAVSGGPKATAPLWVVPQGGRITPVGLPMNVYTLRYKDGPMIYKVGGDGWEPYSALNISVLSGNGLSYTLVATSTVKSDGTFGAAFDGNLAWSGRSDLGVRAATTDGQQYSVRYLPFTDMMKMPGTANTYQATGHNWPASTRVLVVLRIEGAAEEVIESAVTDAIGQFSLQVRLPRIPENNKNEVEIRAADQPYSAWFDF